MNKQNKSLLVHNNSVTNQTTSIVVDEKDIVQKTKAFLEKIVNSHKEATVDVYSPLGVVLQTDDDDQHRGYAVAYEHEKFVVVAPNGTTETAKAYGNWDEALNFAKRLLIKECNFEKTTRITLAEYNKRAS